MPKYFCDYCDTYLTHDSPSVRKTHNSGRKHKDNVKFYYTKWMEDQAQQLIDQTIKQAEKSKQVTLPNMPTIQLPPGIALPPGMPMPPPGMMPGMMVPPGMPMPGPPGGPMPPPPGPALPPGATPPMRPGMPGPPSARNPLQPVSNNSQSMPNGQQRPLMDTPGDGSRLDQDAQAGAPRIPLNGRDRNGPPLHGDRQNMNRGRDGPLVNPERMEMMNRDGPGERNRGLMGRGASPMDRGRPLMGRDGGPMSRNRMPMGRSGPNMAIDGPSMERDGRQMRRDNRPGLFGRGPPGVSDEPMEEEPGEFGSGPVGARGPGGFRR